MQSLQNLDNNNNSETVRQLLLITNRKLRTGFRLLPTLNDLEHAVALI